MASPDLPVTIDDLQILVPSLSGDGLIFIDSADAIVQELVVGCGYEPRVVYLIELYLAAHFASTLESDVKSKQIGRSGEEYFNPSEGKINLETSKFGQRALLLDTKNCLANLMSKAVKARFRVY